MAAVRGRHRLAPRSTRPTLHAGTQSNRATTKLYDRERRPTSQATVRARGPSVSSDRGVYGGCYR